MSVKENEGQTYNIEKNFTLNGGLKSDSSNPFTTSKSQDNNSGEKEIGNKSSKKRKE